VLTIIRVEQAELRWLQNQSEINGDNLNNVICETRINFRDKRREYLKGKIKSFKQIVRTEISETYMEV
jgi:hypothetical protein